MLSVRKPVLLCLLMMMAVSVNGQTSDSAGTTVLPVNRDEAAAIARGELAGELARLRVSPPSTDSQDPRWAEIDELRQQQTHTLDALAIELDGTRDHQESLDIQRRMAAVKETTEVQILRIQERYARMAGDEALAQRMAVCIETILNPMADRAPIADSASEKEVQ